MKSFLGNFCRNFAIFFWSHWRHASFSFIICPHLLTNGASEPTPSTKTERKGGLKLSSPTLPAYSISYVASCCKKLTQLAPNNSVLCGTNELPFYSRYPLFKLKLILCFLNQEVGIKMFVFKCLFYIKIMFLKSV